MDESLAVITAMTKKLNSEHHHFHHGIYSIFQASLAMVVDIVVDFTVSFGLLKTGINKRTVVA